MKQAFALMAGLALLLATGGARWEAEALLALAYGVQSLLAVGIAATFLWLWQVRATPLALGMAFAWAGLALLMAWLWAVQSGAVPDGLPLVPLACLLCLGTGAVLHFAVIQSSFALSGPFFLLPLGLAVAAMVAVQGLP